MSNIDIDARIEFWKEKGFVCEIWTLEPGGNWSDAGHEGDEVFLLLEGEMEASSGTTKRNLEIGEEFFISANEPHSVFNPGEKANRVYWIHSYHWSPSHGKKYDESMGRKIS
ncbi:MAG: cupin domain-containing protein [Symploca sp. SIO2B6]|nr:cupin domain-containing protein [Symploca sp. SIO2B6]